MLIKFEKNDAQTVNTRSVFDEIRIPVDVHHFYESFFDYNFVFKYAPMCDSVWTSL